MRTFSPSRFNHLANLPGIRETFQHHQPLGTTLDFSDLIADHRNIFLTAGDDACAYFVAQNPLTLDAHSIAAPSCRGRRAIAVAKACFEWIWTNTNVQIVTGNTPVELRAARMFNRLVGFTSIGVSPWVGALGQFWAEQYYIERPADK